MNKPSRMLQILKSWSVTDNPFCSTEEILAWIRKKASSSSVRIEKIPYTYEDGFWYYDSDELGILNRKKSYFAIKGIHFENSREVIEQPIIVQDGIGYLGIIAKVIDGVMYFLMQAKVEPGNVNHYQISPTIQATHSNFTRVHGGKEPAFFSYFANSGKYEIIADQIQSEQSSRFLGKRNRNIILLVEDDLEVPETHRWMTLGQLKQLMHYDNIVNMDTRSVISCIPFSMRSYSGEEIDMIRPLFRKEAFFNSMFVSNGSAQIPVIYNYLNDFKMKEKYARKLIDLKTVSGWAFGRNGFESEHGSFRIVYCDIEVEDREVRQWSQPLLEAVGRSEFCLIYKIDSNNVIQFLVQAKSEVGCFDMIEIAPSIQKEPTDTEAGNCVDEIFRKHLKSGEGIEFRGIFSEEGGRFYHEENWNTLLCIREEELPELPAGYFWLDFHAMNILIQFNNCLNIQLRNLLSLLDL